MTYPSDVERRREFRVAALVMSGVSLVFASTGVVAVGAHVAADHVPLGTAGVAVAPVAVTTTTTTTSTPPVAASTDDANAPVVVNVVMGEFFFAPKTVTVPSGRPIRFEVSNPGAVAHELVIGDKHVQDDAEKMMGAVKGAGADAHGSGGHGTEAPMIYLEAGDRGVLEATFDTPGELIMGCHVPGHWAAGMKGTLVVT